MSTLLVLICTDNFSGKFYWHSLTDDQMAVVLRDLGGEDSGDNETRSDNDNNEDCVSLGRRESSI